MTCASRKTCENLYSAPYVFFLVVTGEEEAQPCTFFLDRGMNDGLDIDPMVKKRVGEGYGLSGSSDDDRDSGKAFRESRIKPRIICQ